MQSRYREPEEGLMTAENKKADELTSPVPSIIRSMRDYAEEQLARTPQHSPDLKAQTTEELIHELQVHQIELETQAEELRRVQLALEESRDKYLDLYDFAPIGYLTLSDRALIVEANLNGAKLLGVERGILANARFRQFIAPEYLDPWDRYFVNVLNQGEKQSCTISLKRADGTLFHALLESIRTDDHSYGTPTVRVAISDITNITQAEMALQVSNKKLTLLSSITRHDIMNQITVLSGSLEIALGKVKEPERIANINRALKAAKTIQRQISFTKEYEDLGARTPVWQRVSVALRSATSQITTDTISFELPDDNLEIYADPLLVKVFYNLFDNARQHGGTVTRIRVAHHPAGTGLVISVADNGVGVPLEDKTHVFERGFGKNTGLGLFLSREILSITGISISETGVPGKGALFEIAVPERAFRFAEVPVPA
jgi:PAS domain S-box-containing protein